jgi:hypothetical protein
MNRSLFRIGAVCAGLSAITTLLLALLAGGSMERLWVNFVHIFLALAGYTAAAVALWPKSRAGAALGLVWFLIWGFTELLGVSIRIWTVEYTWRPALETAGPEQARILQADIDAWMAVWDGMFVLILAAFLLGTLCHGLALSRGAGLERVVGVLMLLAVPLTAAIFLDANRSVTWLGGLVGWTYPVLQPVSRALLGVWLWRRDALSA